MKRGAITFSLACLILIGCMKEDTEENFARGMEMLYNGSYEDAESHFLTLSRRIEKNGKNEERIWQAKSLYEVGRIEHLYLDQPQRAVARLREAVKIFPEANFAFKAQKEMAFIFYDRLRDYRTAALEFERLVNAFPDRDDIWKFQYRIAQSYFMIREFDQARAEVRLLLEKHKKGSIAAEAMLLVANSYYVQGRYREAAEAHQALLNIRPAEQIEARSLFEMGMCYQELGDYALAEKSYLAALKKHPGPDLVKIQLTSLQKQMLEEQGEKKEEFPFSHGAKKITNPKIVSKTVTNVKNTKENQNKDVLRKKSTAAGDIKKSDAKPVMERKDVETKKIEDDHGKTGKKQSPELLKDKPEPENDKPSSVPAPKAPVQKETKKP